MLFIHIRWELTPGRGIRIEYHYTTDPRGPKDVVALTFIMLSLLINIRRPEDVIQISIILGKMAF